MTLEVYSPEDVDRSLVAALCLAVKVYVANGGTNTEHLRGMFDLAEHQAEQYGLSWSGILERVRRSLSVQVLAAVAAAWPQLELRAPIS